MNYRIIPQKHFLKELKRLAKKYHSLKQDAGIDLGCGIRKIRMAIGSKNKGKSHGARVITYTYTVNDTEGIINLIYIYDKEESESITDNEIKWLVKEVER